MHLQTGKLYCNNQDELLAITEHQYNTNLLPTILRIEKLYSTGAKTFKGKFDIIVLTPNTIILLLDVQKKFIAGIPIIVLKTLWEDKILYIPFSQQRNPELILKLIEQV